MAIMVKDISGGEREVASKDMTNAALGFGIAGTALGILNGGLLGLGAAAASDGVVGNGIDCHMYYRDC